MSLSLKDQYHGAAMIKIAEYPQFKAINSFEPTPGQKSYSAFTVNDDTGVYLKYGSNPTKTFKEYSFVFNKANFAELAALKVKYKERVFLLLICVRAKCVCVLELEELEMKRAQRESKKGAPEDQYQLLVAVRPNKRFEVYMNVPGVRKTALTRTFVNRNEFPKAIFDAS
jgi:hypothetical protein